MKRKSWLLISMIFCAMVTTVNAEIMDVSISPIEPTIYDPISIIVEGVEGTRPVGITPTLTVDENHIVLDLAMEVGILDANTPWSYTEHLGNLPEGIYNLDVNAIYSPSYIQTVSTSFEVVPEPLTLAFMALGGLFIRA